MASFFRLFTGLDMYSIWTEMFVIDIVAVAEWRTLTRIVQECMSTEYTGTYVQVHECMSTEYTGTCVQGTEYMST